MANTPYDPLSGLCPDACRQRGIAKPGLEQAQAAVCRLTAARRPRAHDRLAVPNAAEGTPRGDPLSQCWVPLAEVRRTRRTVNAALTSAFPAPR